MITYPYLGLNRHRKVRVARFPGRKVVLTFYLVSDTSAVLKFSGVIDTSVKSIQRRFGEPAFDLQQLEACTQELQHILDDSLLKSSPVIVRLNNTCDFSNPTALLALMESLKNARTARTIMLRVIDQTQKAEPHAGLSDNPNSLQLLVIR